MTLNQCQTKLTPCQLFFTPIVFIPSVTEFAMSYREKSVWASFLITLYVAYYYVSTLLNAIANNGLSESLLSSLLLQVVTISITVEVILQTILAIFDAKEADKSIDEREQKFRLYGYRNAYIILTIGVFIALFTLWQVDFQQLEFTIKSIDLPGLSSAYNTLNILLLSFLAAEISFYGTQIFYYRRGY